jgi:hypothetical protein
MLLTLLKSTVEALSNQDLVIGDMAALTRIINSEYIHRNQIYAKQVSVFGNLAETPLWSQESSARITASSDVQATVSRSTDVMVTISHLQRFRKIDQRVSRLSRWLGSVW